jgi:hypothetical protein
MKITDTPLVSREVSQRMDQAQKLKTAQKKQMEEQLMENPSNAFHQSVAASGDTYIAEALRKVRESNVTHPESLTRISGSWMHNQMLNSSQEKK